MEDISTYPRKELEQIKECCQYQLYQAPSDWMGRIFSSMHCVNVCEWELYCKAL